MSIGLIPFLCSVVDRLLIVEVFLHLDVRVSSSHELGERSRRTSHYGLSKVAHLESLAYDSVSILVLESVDLFDSSVNLARYIPRG